MSANQIAGRRILVVEDEMLIVLMIEDVILENGGKVVGPAATLEKALKLAEEEEFDAAVLDVTIRDAKVFPVAERLVKSGVPFAFASGYGDWAMPDDMRDKPRLLKPFTAAALREQLGALCDEAKSRRAAAQI